jgi:hypothetical protein
VVTPATGDTMKAATRADASVATAVTAVVPGPLAAGNVPPEADAILDQYRLQPDSLHKDVRKGCFLYFALAFVLVGIGIGALWIMFRRLT